ncbi:hypothetical protein BHM03_00019969 [Ensete ventricosum]|nr:hypothetical protein BHM03_00019969 [Ensete ventricosum]
MSSTKLAHGLVCALHKRRRWRYLLPPQAGLGVRPVDLVNRAGISLSHITSAVARDMSVELPLAPAAGDYSANWKGRCYSFTCESHGGGQSMFSFHLLLFDPFLLSLLASTSVAVATRGYRRIFPSVKRFRDQRSWPSCRDSAPVPQTPTRKHC